MIAQLASFLIRITPENIGFAITRSLAARTRRLPASRLESEAFGTANAIHYGKDNQNVAWSWGQGPVVILVHGWGGQSAQMAPLSLRLAGLGFNAVAIDITGHGRSPGTSIHWQYFLDDVADLSNKFDGGVHAYVGHSAGALAMMAARKLRKIHASRYVCISAPSHPYPPIDIIRRKLGPPEGVISKYKAFVAGQFESSWEALEPGVSYADSGSNLLLFYDQTDRYVSHVEGDKIQALNPGARLIKTNGHSHIAILQSPELMAAAADFLKA